MTRREGSDSVTRRAYLRAAVGTATAVGLAGCGSDGDTTESPTPTRAKRRTTPERRPGPSAYADRFDTVVNVARAGADRSGQEPINSVLDDHVADDTLLYFPPGEYRLARWQFGDVSNLGLLGPEATLVPEDDERSYWFIGDRFRRLLFEGFTIDNSAEGAAPIVLLVAAGGKSVVRDVTVSGYRDAHPRNGFELAVRDADAELLLENVRMTDGSFDGAAIYAFPNSPGTLTFKNCRVANWSEGLYASAHPGPLYVLGGDYANNGIDQVRVGGGTAGAVVRGVTVRVDDPEEPVERKPNMRGIWLEEGTDALVENCDVRMTDLTGTYSSGGIVVGQQFGAATIRNTRIRTDVDVYAVQIRSPVDRFDGRTMPSMNRLPSDWRVDCQDLRVFGAAARGAVVQAVDRNDCTFDRLCIQQTNGRRDGIGLTGSDNCAVRNSTINVGGRPIVLKNATASMRDVSVAKCARDPGGSRP